MRRWLPLQGLAGGRPGDCNEFLIHRGDGSVEQLDVSSSGEGRRRRLVRDAARQRRRLWRPARPRSARWSRRDVAHGRFDAAIGARCLWRRPRRCRREPRSCARRCGATGWRGRHAGDQAAVARRDDDRGRCAATLSRRRSTRRCRGRRGSGAPLAIAPDHWTSGCPVLIEQPWGEQWPGRDLSQLARSGDRPRAACRGGRRRRYRQLLRRADALGRGKHARPRLTGETSMAWRERKLTDGFGVELSGQLIEPALPQARARRDLCRGDALWRCRHSRPIAERRCAA